MKKRTLKITTSRSDAGFTAIEIAMVAAVIAILSLIVLPIFRNRVEDAKIAAAQADLSALMKAEQVVKADVDAYARLEDLDNVELLGYTSMPAAGVDKEVPFFKYNKPSPTVSPDPATRHIMTDQERLNFAYAGTVNDPVWRGPYIAFQNSITYEELDNPPPGSALPNLRRSGGNGFQAAIQDVPGSEHEDNRYPVDPWGNPYMFFPPTGNAADPSAPNGAYSSAAIYSMGPNGMPGDGSQVGNAAAYTRAYAITNPGPGVLGSDDDLMVEF